MKIKTLDVPLFDGQKVYFSHDLPELGRFLYKKYKHDIEATDARVYGYTFRVDKHVAIYVTKPKHKSTRAYIITLAHECSHASRALLEQIGEDAKPEEVEIRFQDWLLDQLMPRQL